jgi:hypothetical protein
MADYGVKKVSHQQMKTPGAQGGANDIKMKNPARVGAQRNPAASPDAMFGREFNAEKDFGTLYQAKQILANKGRHQAAMNFGMKLRKAGAEVNVRGPTDKGTARGGSPARGNNAYDGVPNASKPNNGSRMDGGKGRW